MTESILRTKSKVFAKDIVLLCRDLKKKSIEGPIINQLLRSGTSIGANLHEAQFAHGTKDFILKLEIALKECNECEYWMELLLTTESISDTVFSDLQQSCEELRRMLISSLNTIKAT